MSGPFNLMQSVAAEFPPTLPGWNSRYIRDKVASLQSDADEMVRALNLTLITQRYSSIYIPDQFQDFINCVTASNGVEILLDNIYYLARLEEYVHKSFDRLNGDQVEAANLPLLQKELLAVRGAYDPMRYSWMMLIRSGSAVPRTIDAGVVAGAMETIRSLLSQSDGFRRRREVIIQVADKIVDDFFGSIQTQEAQDPQSQRNHLRELDTLREELQFQDSGIRSLRSQGKIMSQVILRIDIRPIRAKLAELLDTCKTYEDLKRRCESLYSSLSKLSKAIQDKPGSPSAPPVTWQPW